ncbi:hypothetical protein ACFQUU_23465 [Herbaspirillum sp. GCM10030257]|uniref:hypothetical protein n=1 Tax=Herbaspirillum sp. GCM10030257 TaxID=3273393 RepID=UPI00360E0BD9
MKHSLILASLLATTAAAYAQTGTPSTPSRTEQQGTGTEKQTGMHHRGHDGRHGRPDAKKMSENQVSTLDTDKDGKVSRQEFLARQSEAFSKADTNSDGYVTADELAARYEKHHADMHAKRDARNKAKPNESGAAPNSSDAATPQAK